MLSDLSCRVDAVHVDSVDEPDSGRLLRIVVTTL